MSDTIRFTEEEMQEIVKLQSAYQEKIFNMGQLQLEDIDLEQAKKLLVDKKSKLLEDWHVLQKNESDLLNKLAAKYGDGSLNLKDGTFKGTAK